VEKMKGKRSIRMAIVLVTSFLLVSLVGSGVMADLPRESENEEDSSQSYTSRDPIRIDGNEDFAEKAEENGWPGDGSEDDPYVIEGYEIKGGGDGYGIYIGNVTDFFVIRNSYVHNITGTQTTDSSFPSYLSDGWIILYNSQNGKIEENKFRGGSFEDGRISNSSRKIRISSSKENMIANNSIMNGSIRLSGGSHNIISHNLIQNQNISVGSWNGIALFGQTEFNSVKDNTIINKNYGIHISYDIGHGDSAPEDNNIENNSFINVEEEIHKSIGVENGSSNNDDESWFQTRSFYYIAILLGVSLVILGVGWRRVKGSGKNEG